MSVLELSGVGRTYPGSGDVLRDVELTVDDGELLAVSARPARASRRCSS